MKKRNLKLHDFKRYLTQCKPALHYPVVINGQFYIVNSEAIVLKKWIKYFLKKPESIFDFKSLNDFITFFSISLLDIQLVDAELMNRIGYGIKGIEWWGKRRNADDILPSEYIVKKSLDPKIYSQHKAGYEQLKMWFDSISDYSNVKTKYLISHVYENKITSLVNNTTIGEYKQFLFFLQWLKSNHFISNEILDIKTKMNSFHFTESFYDELVKKSQLISNIKEELHRYSDCPNSHLSNYEKELIKEYHDSYKDEQFHIARKLLDPILKNKNDFLKGLIDGNIEKINQFILEITESFKSKGSAPDGNLKKQYFEFLLSFFFVNNTKQLPKNIYIIFNQISLVKNKNSGVDGLLSSIDKIEKEDKVILFLNFLIDNPWSLYQPEQEEISTHLATVQLLNKGISIHDLERSERFVEYRINTEDTDQIETHKVQYKLFELIEQFELSESDKRFFFEKINLYNLVYHKKLNSKQILRSLDKLIKASSFFIRLDKQLLTSILIDIWELIIDANKGLKIRTLLIFNDIPKSFKLSFKIPEIYKDYKKQIRELTYYREITGQKDLPKSLTEIILKYEKLKKEHDYIEEKLDVYTESHLLKRLSKIKQQLNDFDNIQVNEFKKKLKRSHGIALVQALKYSINDLYKKKVLLFHPEIMKTLLKNKRKTIYYFLKFYPLVVKNKSIIDPILNKYISFGPYYYKSELPLNQQWIESKKDNFNIKNWLNMQPYSFTIGSIEYVLYEEKNIFEIMMMGTYFATCLSIPKGVYSESVIINAADINKKVLYIKDDKGNIVARKLIAINTNNKIIGYCTYGNSELKQTFNNYCHELAINCNISLSNTGIPDTIHAGFWYDDGIEFFGDTLLTSVQKTEYLTFFKDYATNNLKTFASSKFKFVSFDQTFIKELKQNDHDPDLIVDLAIYSAYTNKDSDFLKRSLTIAPQKFRHDILFLWSKLVGEEAIPTLKNLIEFNEEFRLTALRSLFTLNIPNIDIIINKVLNNNIKNWSSHWGLLDIALLCNKERQDLIFNAYIEALKNVELLSDDLDIICDYFRKSDQLIIDDYFFKIINNLFIEIKKEKYQEYSTYNLDQLIYFINNAPLHKELNGKKNNEVIARIILILSKNKAIKSDLLRFLYFNPCPTANDYFRKQLVDGSKTEKEWSALYLAENYKLKHSDRIASLFNLEPDNIIYFVALLLTGNKKIIRASIDQLKTLDLWSDQYELIFDFVTNIQTSELTRNVDALRRIIGRRSPLDPFISYLMKKIIQFIGKNSLKDSSALVQVICDSKIIKDDFFFYKIEIAFEKYFVSNPYETFNIFSKLYEKRVREYHIERDNSSRPLSFLYNNLSLENKKKFIDGSLNNNFSIPFDPSTVKIDDISLVTKEGFEAWTNNIVAPKLYGTGDVFYDLKFLYFGWKPYDEDKIYGLRKYFVDHVVNP